MQRENIAAVIAVIVMSLGMTGYCWAFANKCQPTCPMGTTYQSGKCMQYSAKCSTSTCVVVSTITCVNAGTGTYRGSCLCR